MGERAVARMKSLQSAAPEHARRLDRHPKALP